MSSGFGRIISSKKEVIEIVHAFKDIIIEFIDSRFSPHQKDKAKQKQRPSPGKSGAEELLLCSGQKKEPSNCIAVQFEGSSFLLYLKSTQ